METKDLKISQLALATALDGNETLPFAKSGGNGSLLVSLLKEFIIAGLATSQEVVDAANKAAMTYATKTDLSQYAKKTEIPDISDLATAQSVEDVATSADLIYAKKTDIPDMSGLATRANYQQVIASLQQAEATVERLRSIVDSLPSIPLSDNKCYAMRNGEWVEIAGATEDVLVASQDEEDSGQTAQES